MVLNNDFWVYNSVSNAGKIYHNDYYLEKRGLSENGPIRATELPIEFFGQVRNIKISHINFVKWYVRPFIR